jgi:AGZA family xanthine/uracil permease-like MFS transporter
MMMRQVTLINWRYIGDAIPAFVTLLFMPFSYSVAYGLIAGILTYTVINGLTYITRIVSGGHIVPADEDMREYWTYKPTGTLPWFVRVAQDPHNFFNPLGRRESHAAESIGSSYQKQKGQQEKDVEAVVQELPRALSR